MVLSLTGEGRGGEGNWDERAIGWEDDGMGVG